MERKPDKWDKLADKVASKAEDDTNYWPDAVRKHIAAALRRTDKYSEFRGFKRGWKERGEVTKGQ